MKKISLIYAALIIALAIVLQGCSLWTHEEETNTALREDTVFAVGDAEVSLAEWYLYALPTQEKYENLLGEGIWSYVADDDGGTMASAVKEEIRREITYVKLVSAQAEPRGVVLSEDEELEIELRTAEYLDKLDPDLAAQYGITEAVIRGVYRDNMLATKVYENLTLNVDTYIPDEQVRRMVLQYVVFMKTYENNRGDVVAYSTSELTAIREELKAKVLEMRMEPGVSFSDNISDRYVPIELVADLDELREKLPDELPYIAFAMVQDEISDVIETKDAFFVFDCVKHTDEETTSAAKIAVVEERQRAAFESEYRTWEATAGVRYNDEIWDSLGVER